MNPDQQGIIGIEREYFTDPTVHRMASQGCSREQVIQALVDEKRAMVKRVLELEQIAPKKYQMPDGKVMVWHCPDELIPMT
jgi:hypothetical protein